MPPDMAALCAPTNGFMMRRLEPADITRPRSTILLLSFIAILSAIAIGRYSIRLSGSDFRGAGLFMTHLLIYQERYTSDIARLLTPLAYINPLVMLQYYLFRWLSIDPFYVSYLFVIGANLTLYWGIYYLASVLLNDNRQALLTALFAYVFSLVSHNFALMSMRHSAQIFPDMNFYALGLICIILALLYQDRWQRAIMCLLALAMVHAGHALLILPIIALSFVCRYFLIHRQHALLLKATAISITTYITICDPRILDALECRGYRGTISISSALSAA